jgi:adenylate cyclase
MHLRKTGLVQFLPICAMVLSERPEMQRRLVAILFYDVVGYSLAMSRDEALTLSAQKADFKEVIEPQTQRHNGHLIKTMGDGALIEFSSAVAALQFAISMQCEMASRNAELADDNSLSYRIGINVGDVVVDKDDIVGDGVNIASRLESIAKTGGICIHRSVLEQVSGKLDLDFEDLGEVLIKKTENPVQAYSVTLNDKANAVAALPAVDLPERSRKSRLPQFAAALMVAILTAGLLFWWQADPPVATASVERMVLPLPDEPSLAVLPFNNFSDDRDQDHFADGLTEDLITDLSRISGLFVVARNSSFAYKNQSVNVAQVAETLGVRYILEGSVRRAGDQVRVNAQLIDALTGGHVWAERYEGPVADIFAIQDQFIRKIAKALAVELTVEELEEISLGQTSNLGAREEFQKGLESYLNFTADDNAEAGKRFEAALEIDPEYGRAYAALGLVYLRGCQMRWNEQLGVSVGKSNHISLNYLSETKDRPSSMANVAASSINLYNKQFDVAQSEALRAVAKDPNDPEAFVALAWSMITTGQAEAGLELMDRALRLNPSYPSYYVLAIGMAHFSMGDLETAADVFVDALERDPGATELAAVLAAIYGQLGRRKEANAALKIWSSDAAPDALKVALRNYHFPYSWLNRPEIVTQIDDGLRFAALPLDIKLDDVLVRLRTGGKDERVDAASALEHFSPRVLEVIPALIAALEDDDPAVQRAAIRSLKSCGPAAADALPALRALSDDAVVGKTAIFAIKYIERD